MTPVQEAAFMRGACGSSGTCNLSDVQMLMVGMVAILALLFLAWLLLKLYERFSKDMDFWTASSYSLRGTIVVMLILYVIV